MEGETSGWGNFNDCNFLKRDENRSHCKVHRYSGYYIHNKTKIISAAISSSVILPFTSQLYTNYNYINRDSILLSNSEQYTNPTKTIFLIMSPPHGETI